jgi:hypothetical protein
VRQEVPKGSRCLLLSGMLREALSQLNHWSSLDVGDGLKGFPFAVPNLHFT